MNQVKKKITKIITFLTETKNSKFICINILHFDQPTTSKQQQHQNNNKITSTNNNNEHFTTTTTRHKTEKKITTINNNLSSLMKLIFHRPHVFFFSIAYQFGCVFHREKLENCIIEGKNIFLKKEEKKITGNKKRFLFVFLCESLSPKFYFDKAKARQKRKER
jgi:hypothetical protein